MKPVAQPLTPNEPHTLEQFSERYGFSLRWVKRNIRRLPGRIIESQRIKRIIPAVYFEARVRK